MRRRSILVTGILLALTVTGHAMTDHLSRHLWKSRIVLVFAPALDAPPVRAQRSILAAAADDVSERELVLIVVTPDDVREGGESAPRAPTLHAQEANALRRRFDIDPGTSAVLLIGKDGTEKRRWPNAVQTRELFGLIDAMPMRRREMREGNERG